MHIYFIYFTNLVIFSDKNFIYYLYSAFLKQDSVLQFLNFLAVHLHGTSKTRQLQQGSCNSLCFVIHHSFFWGGGLPPPPPYINIKNLGFIKLNQLKIIPDLLIVWLCAKTHHLKYIFVNSQ